VVDAQSRSYQFAFTLGISVRRLTNPSRKVLSVEEAGSDNLAQAGAVWQQTWPVPICIHVVIPCNIGNISGSSVLVILSDYRWSTEPRRKNVSAATLICCGSYVEDDEVRVPSLSRPTAHYLAGLSPGNMFATSATRLFPVPSSPCTIFGASRTCKASSHVPLSHHGTNSGRLQHQGLIVVDNSPQLCLRRQVSIAFRVRQASKSQ
jgi:hypothetical protein